MPVAFALSNMLNEIILPRAKRRTRRLPPEGDAGPEAARRARLGTRWPLDLERGVGREGAPRGAMSGLWNGGECGMSAEHVVLMFAALPISACPL